MVQKYGAVRPQQAVQIARHTGVPTPGTDNVMHDWRTPEEDMRIREHQTRISAVYEALERLSQLPDARQVRSSSRKRDGIQRNAMRHYATAMGIDWMVGDEIGESIPPAYTEYIGKYLMKHLGIREV